jgi:hypothetical protein
VSAVIAAPSATVAHALSSTSQALPSVAAPPAASHAPPSATAPAAPPPVTKALSGVTVAVVPPAPLAQAGRTASSGPLPSGPVSAGAVAVAGTLAGSVSKARAAVLDKAGVVVGAARSLPPGADAVITPAQAPPGTLRRVLAVVVKPPQAGGRSLQASQAAALRSASVLGQAASQAAASPPPPAGAAAVAGTMGQLLGSSGARSRILPEALRFTFASSASPTSSAQAQPIYARSPSSSARRTAMPRDVLWSGSTGRGGPSRAPAAPGGGSPTVAGGGGGLGSSSFLALGALLLLFAPRVLRRLRLAGEPWHMAPFFLIPARPG